jgi:ABC-2 type transport system permease protein
MRRAGGLKYLAIAAAAARRTVHERAELAGRAVFFVVILFIFSRLWHVVLAHGPSQWAGERELIWYLAVTEWCVLSVPAIFLAIEADVRSGDVACQLVRPVSYVGARVAEGAGDAAVRLLVLGAAGATGAWLLAGGMPASARGLLLVPPLVLLSSLLAVLAGVAIGLSAFWIVDTSPVMWIWSKLVFVLGGLFLPLEIYPDWLRAVARYTPFSAMLWGPARMAFGWAPRLALGTAAELIGWNLLLLGVLVWLGRRAAARLTVHGG